jgi:hypothetical protein
MLSGRGTWRTARPGRSVTCHMRKRAAAWACRPGELSGQLGDSSRTPGTLAPFGGGRSVAGIRLSPWWAWTETLVLTV